MGTEGGGWENDEYLEATKTRPVSDNVELMRQAEVPFPSTSGFLYFFSRKRERYSEYGETFARWTLSRFDLILLVLRHSAARKSGEAYVAALAEEGQKPKPEYVEFIEELRAKLSPEELEMVAAKE